MCMVQQIFSKFTKLCSHHHTPLAPTGCLMSIPASLPSALLSGNQQSIFCLSIRLSFLGLLCQWNHPACSCLSGTSLRLICNTACTDFFSITHAVDT